MKKIFALLLVLSMVTLTFVGCNANKSSSSTTTTKGAVTEGNLKTGLAVITSIGKSKDAGEADGLAQVDSTVVAVTVDKDGKIVKCYIDAAQNKINFSKAGKVTTDLKTEFKTKNELGDEYGMKKASGIKKEWKDQAAALAKYVEGKTVEQVKGIAVNEKGAPKDVDLSSTVTVSIGDYVKAIEKAVANAKDLGAKTGDKLGLGIITDISGSKDVSDKDGLAQAYMTYSAVTFNNDGKITSSVIDSCQGNVNFDATGKITSDKAAEIKTKNELGNNYGMKAKSGIKKEWFEQAESFAKYVVGKTAAEVKGISVNEKTAPKETDLTSSVTISVGGFITVIEKANSNAK